MREWLSGRASPCQGERREFESRLPLHKNDTAQLLCRVFVVYIQNDAKHTKTRHISKNFKKTKKVLTNIKSSAIISNVADNTVMRGWRNRQTRTFEGRVGETVPVQVRSLAPNQDTDIDTMSVSFFYVSKTA